MPAGRGIGLAGGIVAAAFGATTVIAGNFMWQRGLMMESALKKTHVTGGVPKGAVCHTLLQRQKTFVGSNVADCHVGSFPSNSPCEDTYGVMFSHNDSLAAFGVFDGHGGTSTSYYAKNNLLPLVISGLEAIGVDTADPKDIQGAMKKVYEHADHELLECCLQHKNGQKTNDLFTGACVLSMVVTNERVVVANAGDCRAVLAQRSGNIIQLSNDHNATTNNTEVERVRKEHPEDPRAVFRGRIRGSLQPTRAMGDYIYKHKFIHNSLIKQTNRVIFQEPFNPPYVTVDPEVMVHKRTNGDRFVIMGTDGLWDCLSNVEAVEIVNSYEQDKDHDDAENAATYLVRKALEKVGREILGLDECTSQMALAAIEGIPEEKRRHIHDDITVSVVFLDHEKHPVRSGGTATSGSIQSKL